MNLSEPTYPQPVHDVFDAWWPLPDDVRAPGTARRKLAENMQPLAAAARDDLDVLVSEVVTNAVVHGRPDVTLHLLAISGLVRVEVYDCGDAFSVVRAPSVPINQSSGRGLAIVDSLATRWGIAATHARGKSVWFELSVAAAS